VFVPTEEAFAKLPKGTLDHLLDPKNIGELQTVLEYHIIADKALRAGCTKVGRTCGPDDLEGDAIKLGFQPATTFWKTLQGQNLIVFEGLQDNTTTIIGDSTNIGATIQPSLLSLGDGIGTENHIASNGIWHVVDKVLIPSLAPPAPTKTIFDAIEHAGAGYATFVAAIKAAVLDHSLNDPAKGPFTVFVPTEEAFAKLPKGTLDHLLDPKNIGELQTVLEYHIIADKALRAGCTKVGRTCGPDDLEGDAIKLGFQPATTFWKTLQGQNLIVFEGLQDNTTTIIGDSTNIGAKIRQFQAGDDGASGENSLASNGIWHVVDKVLMP